MPYTQEEWLPSHEELTVPELQLTSAVLRAGSLYFGKYCDHQCKEFMLCTVEENDPRKCLNEGKEVTRCGFEFFGAVRDNCVEEFNKYFKCIDHSSSQMYFKNCRKSQAVFDKCMKEKMGIERPEVGYFSRIRVHHTDRPKPQLKEHKLPDAVPDPPDAAAIYKKSLAELKQAKHEPVDESPAR